MIIGRLKKGRITNREKTRTKETKPMFVPMYDIPRCRSLLFSFFSFFFSDSPSTVRRGSLTGPQILRLLPSPFTSPRRGKRKTKTTETKTKGAGKGAVADSISRGTLPILGFPLALHSSSLLTLTAAQLTIFIMYNILYSLNCWSCTLPVSSNPRDYPFLSFN